MILRETNKEIDELSEHLNSKIISFKKKYPTSNLLKYLLNFNANIVCKRMEEYKLTGIEPTPDIDESIKNDILDVINTINRIEKYQEI